MRVVHDDDDRDWDDDEEEEIDSDEDDGDDLLECPSCRRAVHEDTQQCPHCRDWIEPVHPRDRRRQLIWLIAVVGLLIVFLAGILR